MFILSGDAVEGRADYTNKCLVAVRVQVVDEYT
jgi:hypothetical protein